MRDRFPWILTAAYALLFSALGIWRYDVFRNFVDLGIFSQTVASAFGCFCNQIEGSHWAFHFSPILYVVGALVAVWHSPVVLIVVQAVAGALVIPPVYGLVALRASDGTARMAAVVAALYPALAGVIFNDFHENGLAPAAIAWLLWAFDGGRIGLVYLCAAIALCIKEDQALFLAIAGAIGAWRFRGTSIGRAAAIVAVASVLVFAVFFLAIEPRAAVATHWKPTRFYAWTLGDLRALPLGILTRAGFVVLAFAPLCFLPFRSRMMWLAAAPLAEVLLSRMSTTYTMGSHYAGAWAGYALVAFAFAVRAMPQPRARRVLWWCVALSVVELAVANPMHPGMNLRAIQPRDVALDRFLATIPSRMPLATQEEAYTHLAIDHPYVTLLPENASAVPGACYALVDRDYPSSVILIEYGASFAALVRNGTYRLVRGDGNIGLYRRASCASNAFGEHP